MAFHAAGPGGKDSGGDSSSLQEVEKGLLMLIASDTPGLQVGSWQITLLLVQFGMGCWTHNLYILKATVLQQNNSCHPHFFFTNFRYFKVSSTRIEEPQFAQSFIEVKLMTGLRYMRTGQSSHFLQFIHLWMVIIWFLGIAHVMETGCLACLLCKLD
jgi:hypothetical protein